MKAIKHLSGAARAAVQAKLSAADNELRKARDLVQQRTEELGRVRDTVRRYTLENYDLRCQLAQSNHKLACADAESRKHRATIQALEVQVQHLRERITTAKRAAYVLCGVVVVLSWQLSQHVGWFGGL